MKISILCLKKNNTFCEHYKKLFREEVRVYGALGGTGSLAELNKTLYCGSKLAANETSIKQLGKYRENVICPPGAIILLPRDINNAARAHKT